MKTKFNNNNLKLAVQKQGRLTADTIAFLEKAGLLVDIDSRSFYAKCRNFPLDIVFLRDDDIPRFVENGTVDIGIVGENMIIEKDVKVKKNLFLDFGYCRLVVAVQNESSISNINDLKNIKIATSYPKTVLRYFKQKNIPVKIYELEGSVELSPALGISGAIADLTSTGVTLAINDLKIVDTILYSQAVLISQKNTEKQRKILIEDLISKLNSSQQAKKLNTFEKLFV